jgi:hypothetical protein
VPNKLRSSLEVFHLKLMIKIKNKLKNNNNVEGKEIGNRC